MLSTAPAANGAIAELAQREAAAYAYRRRFQDYRVQAEKGRRIFLALAVTMAMFGLALLAAAIVAIGYSLPAAIFDAGVAAGCGYLSFRAWKDVQYYQERIATIDDVLGLVNDELEFLRSAR